MASIAGILLIILGYGIFYSAYKQVPFTKAFGLP